MTEQELLKRIEALELANDLGNQLMTEATIMLKRLTSMANAAKEISELDVTDPFDRIRINLLQGVIKGLCASAEDKPSVNQHE